jgi:hypothetical protein
MSELGLTESTWTVTIELGGLEEGAVTSGHWAVRPVQRRKEVSQASRACRKEVFLKMVFIAMLVFVDILCVRTRTKGDAGYLGNKKNYDAVYDRVKRSLVQEECVCGAE